MIAVSTKVVKYVYKQMGDGMDFYPGIVNDDLNPKRFNDKLNKLHEMLHKIDNFLNRPLYPTEMSPVC